MQNIKQQLHAQCAAYIAQRIETARFGMEEAQKAANEDTKSSAGDKFETGRAMMMMEKEKNAAQLNQALQLQQQFGQINTDNSCNKVQPGALVKTNLGTYYIAISIGKVMLDKVRYYVISIQAPLGLALRNLKQGDEATFNGRLFRIEEIY